MIDDQHRDFDFRLVARPCRQDRGIVSQRLGPVRLGIGELGDPLRAAPLEGARPLSR